jgi:putative tryptophan/tyrosine transport system substrate-binding protein
MQLDRLKRREFMALAGGAIAWPLAARAQQGGRVKRLGMLIGGTDAQYAEQNNQLLDALGSLGWTEGRNLLIDYRPVGSNDPGLIRPHADALIRAAPDVIYASPATAVQVLVTSTIPIVFNQNSDPVQQGTVQSLARPGGNFTGFLGFEPSINAKYVQLLKDIAPRMTRIGVLQTDASRSTRGGTDFAIIEQASRSLGIGTIDLLVRDDQAEFERAVTGFAKEPNGGLILPPDNAATRHRALIVGLATKYLLPTISYLRGFTEAGGLMNYAPAPIDMRRVAGYIDRILRGAKPGELPVVTPDKFNLIINLKTATALGLTIPPSLFALADEVVE